MNLIKIRRLEKDWTQETLAKESGLSHNTISNYERGSRSPRLTELEKIATALECSAKDLLE